MNAGSDGDCASGPRTLFCAVRTPAPDSRTAGIRLTAGDAARPSQSDFAHLQLTLTWRPLPGNGTGPAYHAPCPASKARNLPTPRNCFKPPPRRQTPYGNWKSACAVPAGTAKLEPGDARCRCMRRQNRPLRLMSSVAPHKQRIYVLYDLERHATSGATTLCLNRAGVESIRRNTPRPGISAFPASERRFEVRSRAQSTTKGLLVRQKARKRPWRAFDRCADRICLHVNVAALKYLICVRYANYHLYHAVLSHLMLQM